MNKQAVGCGKSLAGYNEQFGQDMGCGEIDFSGQPILCVLCRKYQLALEAKGLK